MKRYLITQTHLKKLGFEPYYSGGFISYDEEIILWELERGWQVELAKQDGLWLPELITHKSQLESVFKLNDALCHLDIWIKSFH